MNTSRWIAAAALLVVAACGKGDKKPTGAGSGSATTPPTTTPATTDAAAPAGDAPAVKPWALRTAPLELSCGVDRPAEDASYKDLMAEGRAAAKARKWGLAIAAFEAALKDRDGDAAALSELSWAAFQAGDHGYALEVAERAVAATDDPKLKAASHYNAGRAAEARGDLAAAKAHYEQSIALKPNPSVGDRIARLAPAPAPRALERDTALTACQQLPSLAAVCDCLTRSVSAWSGFDAIGSCAPAEQKGTAAQLLMLESAPPDRSKTTAATVIVLAVRRGDTWSALDLVDMSVENDLEEIPHGGGSASVDGYEERPQSGSTLIWVQTRSDSHESANREMSSDGTSVLTLCTIPAGDAPAFCRKPLTLAKWRYTYDASDDEPSCEVPELMLSGARLDSTGRLWLFHLGGTDDGSKGAYTL